MKTNKLLLLLVLSIFLITACGAKPSADGTMPDQSTITEETNEVTKTEETCDDGEVLYEEYLDSLQYLEQIEGKLPAADTTAEMAKAAGEALAAWDMELNRIYSLLTDKLSIEQMEELKTIQRSWIKERDQAAAQYADTFEGGSFAAVAYNDILFQYTKQRTNELILIYFFDSSDYSYDLIKVEHEEEQGRDDLVLNPVLFEVYDVNKKYYGENDSYVELDLKLPILEGDFDGIPAINAYFANKEQFYYEQLPLEMLEQTEHTGTIEGKADGYFVSAYYYLEIQMGDIISIPAVLDGGAGGVSWVALEGNTFNLNTGEQIMLSDLFQVSEDEYLGFIYDYVAEEITKEIQSGNDLYFFQDAYSIEGAEMIRSYNQENFIVSGDGLIVFYQKYELASGAASVRGFEIPYDLIRDMLAINTEKSS